MRVKFIFLIAVAFFITSCGFKELKPLKLYRFDTPKVYTKKHKYKGKTLKVNYPISTKESLSYKMLYSYNNQTIGSYLNSQWAFNKGKLLEGYIINALSKAELFSSVVPYDSIVNEDYRLEVVVNNFYNLVENGKSYAILDIRFTLIDMQENRPIKTKEFRYKEAAPSVDAKGYVEAVNKALEKMANDLIEWL